MKKVFLMVLFFVFGLYGSAMKITIFSLNSPIGSEKREKVLEKILAKEKENISKYLTIANISDGALKKCYYKQKIEKLNDLHIDIITTEPEEMQMLKEEKNKYFDLAKFHFLASNFIDEKGNYLFGPKQTLIYDLKDMKIGLFALYPDKENLKNNIYFLPSYFVAKKMIKELKEKNVDVIIMISHQTLKEDKKLLQTFKNIDMIIGYHKKETISSCDDQTFIYKQNYLDPHLVRVDLVIEKKIPPHNKEIKIYPSWHSIKIEEK